LQELPDHYYRDHHHGQVLRQAVSKTPKRRVRINAHKGSEDELHEMIIAIEPGSYIRPHKHPGKSEAFHIIEGEVDIVVFSEDGSIEQIVSLAEKGGPHPFYYRMSTAYFHTLIIRSDLLVVHEITNGAVCSHRYGLRRIRASGEAQNTFASKAIATSGKR